MEGGRGAEEGLRSFFLFVCATKEEETKKLKAREGKEGKEGKKNQLLLSLLFPRLFFKPNQSSVSKPSRLHPLSSPFFFPPTSRHEVRADSSVRLRAFLLRIAGKAIEKRRLVKDEKKALLRGISIANASAASITSLSGGVPPRQSPFLFNGCV